MKKIFCVKFARKIFAFLFVISIAFFLSGCGENSLESEAKNLTCYDFEIDYNHLNKTLNAKQTVDYINQTEQTFDKLCFHLYPNAFREGATQKVVSVLDQTRAYPNGISYGGINIKSVIVPKTNLPLAYNISGQDQNILEIELENKLFPNDRTELLIEFDVTLPNINHRFGYGENAVNIANFYPVACVYENGSFMTKPYSPNGDPFYSNMANYNAIITYDDSLMLASSGEQIKSQVNDGKKTTEINAKVVRDFAFVVSEKFQVLSEEFEKTKIFYYYYSDQNPQQSLDTSILTLQTFNELFGQYHYSTLSVVETNFLHGGMEYPNLVFISDALSNYEEYTNVIVHEIAHQWWYNMVGSNAYSDGWQDEGLTDYSTALFYEKNPQYNIQYEEIMKNALKNYTLFTEVFTKVYGNVDTSMSRDLDEFKTSSEYVYICYVKSMLMFDNLRKLIGDKRFFKGLEEYFNKYCFKIAKPDDLIACFENISNTNLENFFDSWIEGKVKIIEMET